LQADAGALPLISALISALSGWFLLLFVATVSEWYWPTELVWRFFPSLPQNHQQPSSLKNGLKVPVMWIPGLL